LFLVEKNIPFDVAFKLSPIEIDAYCIIISNNSLKPDKQFNFDMMGFPE